MVHYEQLMHTYWWSCKNCIAQNHVLYLWQYVKKKSREWWSGCKWQTVSKSMAQNRYGGNSTCRRTVSETVDIFNAVGHGKYSTVFFLACIYDVSRWNVSTKVRSANQFLIGNKCFRKFLLRNNPILHRWHGPVIQYRHFFVAISGKFQPARTHSYSLASRRALWCVVCVISCSK